MKSFSLPLILCLCILGFFELAFAEVPETIVEVSIYDLIARPKLLTKSKPHDVLPADYGKNVASIIAGAQPQLLACLETTGDPSIAFLAQIAIDQTGKAKISLNKQEKAGKDLPCIASILSGLQYPKHHMSEAVQVKLPLKITRKST